MLSGGIGITPLRSMCKYCTDAIGHQDHPSISNHSERDIIFREEFEEMQKRNKNLRVVYSRLASQARVGMAKREESMPRWWRER